MTALSTAPQTGPITLQSAVRRPRGVVKINSTTVSFLSFRVEKKTHFSADTWKVEIEPWQQPEGFGLSFFATSVDTQVEILMGTLSNDQDVSQRPSDLTSFIIGQVDDIEISLNEGRLALSGRDFTAKLIDTKTANKWPDHTSSQIVTDLCAQVGLTPNVTATTIPAGQYYNSAYSSVTREAPMWDLITFLAEQEGFDTYVTGSTLYFGPPQADQDPNPFQVVIEQTPAGIYSTAKTLRLHRSETIAKDISVTVLSHSQAKGKGIKAVATRAGSKAGGSSASRASETTQSYVLREPNLTLEQAQQLANSTLLDITRHERGLDFTAEGDVTMTAQRLITLAGTNTAFDGTFYVNTVTHAYDCKSGGYEMSLVCKNHKTLSQESTV